MAKIKRNIWLIFLVVFSACTIAFVSYLLQEWNHHKSGYIDQQKNRIELFANSANAFFSYQASALDILGRYYVSSRKHSPELIHQKNLDHVLESNSAFKAILILDTDSNPLVASSNFNFDIHEKADKNRKQVYRPDKKEGYLHLGRSHKTGVDGKGFVIPIARYIGEQEDVKEASVIVTAGIKFANMPLFHERTVADDHHSLEIVRWDKYLQYSTRSVFADYHQPVPDYYYKQIRQSVVEGVPTDINGVYLQTVSKEGNSYQALIKFVPNLGAWFVSAIPDSHIRWTFVSGHLFLVIGFVAFLIIFFILTRFIGSSEVRKQQALRYQAEHDLLTGLPNRIYLRESFKTWSGKNDSAYLLYIDIDNFKDVNDGFGYTFGDSLLVEIAKRLSPYATVDDLLIRDYANAFILLISDKQKKDIHLLAEEIKHSLSEPFVIKENRLMLTTSIGICSYPLHGDSLGELFVSADIAISNAKQNRNSICLLSAYMVNNHQAQIELAQRLRFAIAESKPYMVYQPQIDRHGQIHGLEALVRWNDEELGFIPPDKFISIAEVSGQMIGLGKLIIAKTLADYADIRQRVSQPVNISINVSVQQFTDKGFVPYLVRMLEHHNIPGSCVTVEVTESIFIEDFRLVRPTCKQLMFYGIRISLDDFGTGYSSLGVLNKIRIGELKIDRTFVTAMTKNKKSMQLLKNILSMSSDLGVYTVAEGVETEEQKRVLLNNGCDVLQGYYFARPMIKSEVLNFIQNYHSKQNS